MNKLCSSSLLGLLFVLLASQAFSEKRVTLVARECPAYTDVMANKARNNIMESLRDLGIDSTYGSNQAVSKATEESVATQLNSCIPLNNWRFTLGSKISRSKDTGSFGSLSKVADVFRTTDPTTNNTEVLNSNGSPSGDTIDGAVNVTLNNAELQALSRGALTMQGGRPGSPLLGSQVLGFATLRCGLDNRNADNVEFLKFPSNVSRIFCYAYYINPAPSAAKIIIRKVLEGSPPSGLNPDFVFGGNVSFESNGTFDLKAGTNQEFDRAANSPENPLWIVNEDVAQLAQGYRFKSVSCSAEGGGGSTSTISGSQVTIDLKAGDTVTCSFTNTYTPPAATVNISPILECTSRATVDLYTGHFGYFSRETSTTSVPPGANNQFVPAPANRGQPYSFAPGRFAGAVSVDHSGANLTWKLGSRTATSSSAAAQRCKPSCILPSQVQANECDPTILIDGSNSATLNNDGQISSFRWSTNCDGSLINADTLRPSLVLNLADLSGDEQKCKVSLTVTDDTQFGISDPREVNSDSCDVDVLVPTCVTDCAGIPNGSTEIDQCGVCGGDNSTCLDCAGIPNGGTVVDECGVCGGDNSSCSDCSGIPNGSNTVDVCGVCGGDGSSCSAVCSESDLDSCGVCFGDNSSCLDCSGTPNGGTDVDTCGVCGGDGSSCGQCIPPQPPSASLRATVKEIARDIALLTSIARRYSKEAISCSPTSASRLRADQKEVAEIASLITQETSDIHIDVEAVCSNQTCLNVSIVKVESDLKALTRAIRKLILDSKEIVSQCRAPIRDDRATRKSRDIAKDLISAINSLPDEVLTCSN